ncbi:hypothetical protein [Streptomyces scopuliridis]|uniref:Uncharacterized protein n=1 Tax=Streptomyces scopuliridis TaxID=452529 RepID=A0ACD4ZSV4_9ACTN|nr:hypothetical protein [Streptomyces scopuliridis]WSC01236.1 hypothetical protein OG835_32395 [Streptomyces scopuliridis]
MSFHSVAKHALTVYYDGDADLAGKVLNGIAHELAATIRTEVQTLKDDGVLEPDKDWAAGDAADLIDPEVST